MGTTKRVIESFRLIAGTIPIAVVGGIIAYFLGIGLVKYVDSMYFTIVTGIFLIVGIGLLMPKVKFDNVSLATAVMTFIMLGIIGSAISLAAPNFAVGQFILSAPEFSWIGLGWTFFYVMLAEWVMGKLIK